MQGHRERQPAGPDGAGLGGADEVGVDEVGSEFARHFGDRGGAIFRRAGHVGEIGKMRRLGKSEARGTGEGGDADADAEAREFRGEVERHALGSADLDGRHELEHAQGGVMVRVERREVDGAEPAVADQALERPGGGVTVFQ